MPINSLQMQSLITPFDDLESIFYILFWIVFGHKQPLLQVNRVNVASMGRPLSKWFGGNDHSSANDDVAESKYYFLKNHSEIQTVRDAWVPLLPLLNMYYKLLHERQIVMLQYKNEGLHVDLETSCKGVIEAFDNVLGYFTETLERLEMAG
jgi:hypothetical protein